jgi:hypothetical protein
MSAGDPATLAKYVLTKRLMDVQSVVRLCIDGRHPDIDIPEHLWERADVELYIGRGTRPRIQNLYIHPIVGITGTLRMQSTPYHCVLPWAAIYGIGSHMWWGEIPECQRAKYDLPRSAMVGSAPAPNPFRVVPNEGGPNHAA